MNATENQRLLVKVARLYYEQDLTQNEIGERLRLSRHKVQRLLRKARGEGVVQIYIRPVMGTYPELEKALEQSFGLPEAVIVETSAFENQPTVAREVGAGAAQLGTWLALGNFSGRSFLLSVVNTGMALPPVVVGLVVAMTSGAAARSGN